ncbi:hypothetical protein ACFSTC_18610 [Nonomuraea ferruginea]
MTVLLERPRTAQPAARDPFIDVLRVLGMALVVLQHWTIPVLGYDGARLTTGNALATPGVWVVTWISQVMPLVFFAGGAANAISFRRSAAGGPRWLTGWLRRLAWPLLPLAAVWIPLPHLLLALGVPEQPLEVGGAADGPVAVVPRRLPDRRGRDPVPAGPARAVRCARADGAGRRGGADGRGPVRVRDRRG